MHCPCVERGHKRKHDFLTFPLPLSHPGRFARLRPHTPSATPQSLTLLDLLVQLGLVVVVERWVAPKQDVRDHPDAPHIDRLAVHLSLQDLRCHVPATKSSCAFRLWLDERESSVVENCASQHDGRSDRMWLSGAGDAW